MLNRVSINALLKSVILVLCTSLVIILALGAWDSWQRVNTATRIASVAEASTHLFKALHNLRSDRSRTVRVVSGGTRATRPTRRCCGKSRDAEVPALEGGAGDAPGHVVPRPAGHGDRARSAHQHVDRGMHAESLAAAARPKSERPAGLAKTIIDEMSGVHHLHRSLDGSVESADQAAKTLSSIN